MTTLDSQIVGFCSLGEVGDPAAAAEWLASARAGSDEAVAAELAATLMRTTLGLAPLERIGRLTKLLRILKLTVRMVTAERDLAAYSATAIWPYRKLSKLLSAHTSTMQAWVNAGRKVAEPQQVPRGTVSANSVENSNSNSEFAAIQ